MPTRARVASPGTSPDPKGYLVNQGGRGTDTSPGYRLDLRTKSRFPSPRSAGRVFPGNERVVEPPGTGPVPAAAACVRVHKRYRRLRVAAE
jgi:hypothetical protein